MKKRNIDSFIIFGWIIFVVIIIGLLLIIYPTGPEFTIYKEECNETIHRELYQEFVNHLDINPEEIRIKDNSSYNLYMECPITLDCHYTNKHEETCGVSEYATCKVYKDIKIEVCEKVEVDKISFTKEQFMDYCSEDNKGEFATCEDAWIWARQNSGYAIIFKEDLTISWLNENCEILCEIGMRLCDLKKGDIYISSLNGIYRNGSKLECEECLKNEYKCGEYFVEVK